MISICQQGLIPTKHGFRVTDAHVDDADPDDVASNDSRRSVEPLKVPNMSYNTFMTHCQELAAAVVGDQCMARPALALILKARTMFQSRSLDNLDATSNALIIEAHSQLRGRKNLIQYNLEATDAYVDRLSLPAAVTKVGAPRGRIRSRLEGHKPGSKNVCVTMWLLWRSKNSQQYLQLSVTNKQGTSCHYR